MQKDKKVIAKLSEKATEKEDNKVKYNNTKNKRKKVKERTTCGLTSCSQDYIGAHKGSAPIK